MSDSQNLLSQAISIYDQPPDVVRWHYINAALEACNGDKSAAARRMGMHRRTLQRIMAKNPKVKVQHE